MAIISIPSSIGGVSIPGAALKGPLGKLFGNSNQIATYTYPRDLGSGAKGHWITFTIYEMDPASYDTVLKYDSQKSFSDNIGESAKTLGKNSIEFGKNVMDQGFTLSPQKKKIKSTVSLYMPDTMNFTNSASYGNLSLMEVLKEIVGKTDFTGIGKAAISIADSQTAKVALSSQGLAVNPQQQLLFDGIDFRSFTMSFVFTPYSKDEADAVKQIVQLFKAHAAPRIANGAGGMFFIPPSIFDLEFNYNGKRNQNIPKIGDCVIESIDVNYAPNGWSAHTDGAPVQTTMSIQFKETVLVDRNKIESYGY